MNFTKQKLLIWFVLLVAFTLFGLRGLTSVNRALHWNYIGPLKISLHKSSADFYEEKELIATMSKTWSDMFYKTILLHSGPPKHRNHAGNIRGSSIIAKIYDEGGKSNLVVNITAFYENGNRLYRFRWVSPEGFGHRWENEAASSMLNALLDESFNLRPGFVPLPPVNRL